MTELRQSMKEAAATRNEAIRDIAKVLTTLYSNDFTANIMDGLVAAHAFDDLTNDQNDVAEDLLDEMMKQATEGQHNELNKILGFDPI